MDMRKAGTLSTSDSGSYSDLNRLNQLKVGDKNSDANMRKVAQEFESLFLGEMLKSMRSATEALGQDNPLNTPAAKQYQEMYDQQLAVSLSREGGGIGLADVLMDCVHGGASVSFMSPLPKDRAVAFWRGTAARLAEGRCALLIAEDSQGIVGTVQLILDLPENQPHRADLPQPIPPIRPWNASIVDLAGKYLVGLPIQQKLPILRHQFCRLLGRNQCLRNRP